MKSRILKQRFIPFYKTFKEYINIGNNNNRIPKFNISRQILGNPPTMQQALGEESSKNIYNFFTNIGLGSKITVKNIYIFKYFTNSFYC